VWNGECETVYEDMYGYVTTYAGGRCRKNYELTIIADMNIVVQNLRAVQESRERNTLMFLYLGIYRFLLF